MSRIERCDVAVVGAGPAGCATALALGAAGLDVCLVDDERRSGPRPGETLLPETRALLDELGLWQGFLAEGHEVCLGSSSAWGNATLGFNDFVVNPGQRGWHLDRARFDAWLLAAALSRDEVRFVAGRVEAFESRGHDRYDLVVGRRREALLAARFVVDATGRRSALARRLGASQLYLDRLTFVYGFFDASGGSSASRLTLLEAAEAGWWYAASVPGHRRAVAFATDAEIVRDHALHDEDRWFSRVLRTRHVAARLDGCRYLRGSLAIHPAPSFRLDAPAGRRWLAVGDAAASYDPLAAQGIHKALSDGLAAARVVAAALEGDLEATRDYAAGVLERFEEYTVNRNYFYGLERRWADAPFWRRRHERTAVAGERACP